MKRSPSGKFCPCQSVSHSCHDSTHIPTLIKFVLLKGRLSGFYMVYFQQLEKIGVQKERIIYEVKRFMDSVSSSREASQRATLVAVIQSDW
jgi:hypothetical protein